MGTSKDVWADDYVIPEGSDRCPAKYGSKHQCNHHVGHAGLHWACGGNFEWNDAESPASKLPAPSPAEPSVHDIDYGGDGYGNPVWGQPAPSPAGETASEEQCKHCDGPMPPLGAASMCPEHPHQPLSGMCEGSGDDTVCSGCGEDAFYDNGDVTYACGCNRGWTLRRKFLMRKSDAVPEPVSPGGAALGTCADFPTTPHQKGTCENCDMWTPLPSAPEAAAEELIQGPTMEGFEEWWAKYLAGREINPFPDKASLWNAKQAAWSSWHAAVGRHSAPEAAAAIEGICKYPDCGCFELRLGDCGKPVAAPIAPAAVSGLFDAWWIEHSRYGYASNEELAVAAWNAAVSSQTYVPETQLTAALRSNREKDAKIAELESYRLNADHALNLGILDSQELQDRLRAVSEALEDGEQYDDIRLARIRAIVEGK